MTVGRGDLTSIDWNIMMSKPDPNTDINQKHMTLGERGHVQGDGGAVIDRNRNKSKKKGRERLQNERKMRKREEERKT